VSIAVAAGVGEEKSIMKKAAAVIMSAVVITISLCSCIGGFYTFEQEEKIANEIAAKVLLALENQEEAALKSLFCEYAVDNIVDLDKGIAYSMEVFKGKVVEIKQQSASYYEHIDHGKKNRRANVFIFAATDSGEFKISFEYCYYSSFSKTEKGIWSFRVERYEEGLEVIDMEFYKTKGITGAYYPGWIAPY
jgi:hypothetical protein